MSTMETKSVNTPDEIRTLPKTTVEVVTFGEVAWEEIEHELRKFEGSDGFAGPCELIVAVGTM